MNSFLRGLSRFLGAILTGIASIMLGGVIAALGFVAVAYGTTNDATLFTVIGSVMMFFGFILVLRYFV